MDRTSDLLTYQQAAAESERCLRCFDAPCIQACPTHIDIPSFIAMLRSGNVVGAAEVVKTSNALANVCGKVCPEEIYCQSVCNRAGIDSPVRIRELHFYATQQEARRGYSSVVGFPRGKKKIAVIGAGPSGLGCAFEAAKLGYQVMVFDRKGPGGVPASSIPSFRLPEEVLEDDLRFLLEHFRLKRRYIGVSEFDGLKDSFNAVFVSVGLGEDRRLGLKGEGLRGVIPVLRFLEGVRAARESVPVGKRVVIVGGGNVSLDAASTAKRLGARDVILIYRRSEREMKIWKSELEESRRQGVTIRFLARPVEIVGGTSVDGVICRGTALSRKKDGSGRPVPVDVKGSEFTIAADTVIVAVGQVIASDIAGRLRRGPSGFIAVDGDFRTSLRGVFAGGDAVSGEGTIVQSVAHGKGAARAMDNYLTRT